MNCIIFDTISSFSCVRTSSAISLSIDASTSTKTCKSSAEDSMSKLRKRDEDEDQRGRTYTCIKSEVSRTVLFFVEIYECHILVEGRFIEFCNDELLAESTNTFEYCGEKRHEK